MSDKVEYEDQYGEKLDKDKANAFLKEAINNGFTGDKEKYGILVEVPTGSAINVSGSSKYLATNISNDDKLDVTLGSVATTGDASNINAEYSVVKVADTKKDLSLDNSVAVGDVKRIVYTEVPISMLGDLRIKAIDKVRVETVLSSQNNGRQLNGKFEGDWSNEKIATQGAVTNGADYVDVVEKTQREVKVLGSYNGKQVTLPNSAWTGYYNRRNGFSNIDSKVESKVELTADGKISKIKELTWGELYDSNTANNTRKEEARKSLAIVVDSNANKRYDDGDNVVRTNVSITDILRRFGSIKLRKDDKDITSAITLKPSYTHLKFKWSNQSDPNKKDDYLKKLCDEYDIKVVDDCGNEVTSEEYKLTFKVENYKESTTKSSRMPNSHIIKSNDTDSTSIDGVEIGDTFDLTIAVQGSNASFKIPVTVGADKKAFVANINENEDIKDEPENSDSDSDKSNDTTSLRSYLGYTR